MMRLARCGVVAGLLGLVGCTTTAQAPTTANVSAQDLNFVTAAYQLVHFDLAACSIVQKSDLTPEVKPAADKICADAEKYEPVIRSLASRNNVRLPDALPIEFKALLVSLTYHPEPDISVEFLRDEISSHESALAVFRDEAWNGTNPEFKAIARRTTPLLERNLDMLRAAMPKGVAE